MPNRLGTTEQAFHLLGEAGHPMLTLLHSGAGSECIMEAAGVNPLGKASGKQRVNQLDSKHSPQGGGLQREA